VDIRKCKDYIVGGWNRLAQGFLNWSICAQRVHLPIWRGTYKFSNRTENICLYIIDFKLFTHISVNIIFKNHYVLFGEHIFIIFLSLFVVKILEVNVHLPNCWRDTWPEKLWGPWLSQTCVFIQRCCECTSLCSAKTLIFHGCKLFVAGLVTV